MSLRLRQEVQALPRRPAASERLSSSGSNFPITHVVAAAVTRDDGRVLLAQRPAGKHLAGAWEFPGGKLERGEARVAGLSRELREELGIEISQPRPLIRVHHAYPHGEVLIDMWVVTRYAGEPRGLDGQALQWCLREELASIDLLPADRPIVRALSLPEWLTAASSALYEIRDPRGRARWGAGPGSAEGDPRAGDGKLRGMMCGTAEQALSAAGAGGLDMLVMRSRLPEPVMRRLCEEVPIAVYASGIPLEAAWALGATGVSLLEG